MFHNNLGGRFPIGRKTIDFFFFRSDSSFPNTAYNSLLYCILQMCLFPLPFPRYVNGKFWEENFDGKRKKGVVKDTEIW